MIECTVDGKIGRIVLRGVGEHNYLSGQDIDDLGATWNRLFSSDDVRVIVISSASRAAFSAGADIGSIGTSLASTNVRAATTFGYSLKGVAAPKPTISVLSGYVLGAGFEIMAGTDIRLASDDAQFGLPEVRWGAVAMGGSVARTLRELPRAAAMRLLLTGERIDAATALHMGLVSDVVPAAKLEERVEKVVANVLANSPAAVSAIKEIANHVDREQLDHSFALERLFADRVAATDDAREGAAAFAEKRRPQFD